MSQTDVSVTIHLRNGATPKACHAPNGTRWLELDDQSFSPTLFAPRGPHAAIAYLDALISAAAELRDAIAANAGLTTAALAA